MIEPIYPCLWFDSNAREAAEFYRTVFPDSEITGESPIVVYLKSAGQKFMLLNGGPMFKINYSVSFFVLCETEPEVDLYWGKLIQGGTARMEIGKYPWSAHYGWVEDRYGVNWQLYLGKMDEVGQKFTPTLMFSGEQNGKAREAIGFYTSVFKDSSIRGIMEYDKDDNDIAGHVKHAQFNLGKAVFMAMDSSMPDPPPFNEAISFVVECEDQAEIDYFWDRFTAEGEESMCGWCTDKYGVWWQVVPAILNDLMNDPERSERVVQAFLKMRKFDIDALLKA